MKTFKHEIWQCKCGDPFREWDSVTQGRIVYCNLGTDDYPEYKELTSGSKLSDTAIEMLSWDKWKEHLKCSCRWHKYRITTNPFKKPRLRPLPERY